MIRTGLILLALTFPCLLFAQQRPTPKGFNWVSPGSEKLVSSLSNKLRHRTYHSQSMGIKVGYYVYLPPGYYKPENSDRRYPVVYNLHGGRPGGEYKMVHIHRFVDDAIRDGKIEPVIYVFPNGGPMSWYNYPQFQNGQGEDVFVKELIPHIDLNYRTVDNRSGRAIQGFSQGGRGATRIAFKYPDLFSSVAAGGGAYRVEMQIAENNGVEYDTRRDSPERLDFGVGNDAYSLAKSYSNLGDHRLSIAFWGGTKGFNYNDILEYMEYLDSLGINYQSYFVGGIGHNSWLLYHSIGIDLQNFHVSAFEKFAEDS